MAEKQKQQPGPELTWFESPIVAFPGRIGFPKYMTGRVYRRYLRALEAAQADIVARGAEDPETLIAVTILVDGGEGQQPDRFGLIHWQVALKLAMVELEGLPAGWDDPTGEDAPVTLIAWFVGCFKTWLEPLVWLKNSPTRSGGA
jgi:hypothetical protein